MQGQAAQEIQPAADLAVDILGDVFGDGQLVRRRQFGQSLAQEGQQDADTQDDPQRHHGNGKEQQAGDHAASMECQP
jgi:hypothetical protein